MFKERRIEPSLKRCLPLQELYESIGYVVEGLQELYESIGYVIEGYICKWVG